MISFEWKTLCGVEFDNVTAEKTQIYQWIEC